MGGEGTRPDSDLGSRVCTFRATGMQLQDNGKGGRRRNFRLPGDSSSQVHLSTEFAFEWISLVLPFGFFGECERLLGLGR